MDFIKLQELPRPSIPVEFDEDVRRFKSFKSRIQSSTGVQNDISSMSFSPLSDEGSSHLAMTAGTRIQIYDVSLNKCQSVIDWSKHKNMVNCVSFRGDGKLIIAGDTDGHANIYDVAEMRTMLKRLRGHDGAVYSAVFGNEVTSAYTAGADMGVKLWDIPSDSVVRVLSGHTDSVRHVASWNNGCISGSHDGSVIVWDPRVEDPRVCKLSHGCQVDKLALFRSSGLLFSIGGDSIRLWDMRMFSDSRGQLPIRHSKQVSGAAVSDCGDFLATSSFDGSVKIHRISSWDVVSSYNAPSAVTSLAWSGNNIAYGMESGSFIIRQRRQKGSNDLPEKMSILADNTRYYTTVNIEQPNKSKTESTVDHFFRKFEYRKLIDFILEGTPQIPLAVAIVDELIQRDALSAALRDRSTNQVNALVGWCSRMLTKDPRCTIKLVSRVFNTLVDSNPKVFTTSEVKAVESNLKTLNDRIAQEMNVEQKVSSVVGILDAIMNNGE